MRVRVAFLSLLLTGSAISCGIVEEGKVERIDPPFGLADTLPTSTTIATTTTEFVTTTSGLETTTTVVQTEPVRLYFIASGQLTSVAIPLPSPAALPQIIYSLQTGLEGLGDLGTGLRSAVPREAEIRVSTDGSGVAVVDLPADFFDSIAIDDQRLVIAQIVLTLTDSRGVGQVRFTRAGAPYGVQKGNGEVADPGQTVAARDYQRLLSSTTVTPTTAVPTTVPVGSTTNP